MVFWNHRMNLLSGDSKYVDVLERSMYNGALAGISLSGDRFFYVNPLESDGHHHRKAWYRTACCPSQISRFLPSIGNYLYATADDTLWVNLYIGSTVRMVHQEANLEIKQITDYPWDGKIRFELKSDKSFHSTFKFRIPAWCTHYSLSYNGQIQEVTPSLGYASLSRKWKDGDVVELDLEMPVQVLSADPRVKANVGKRAIQRGPLVYCLEEIDNLQIDDAVIEPNMHFTTVRNDLLDIVEIRGVTNGQVLKFVPYYIWDNREAGKMKVWIDASL